VRQNFPYQRMPGRLRGWFRKATLWEGADHLLLVRGTRFNEEYRRFYYRDIESLQIARTLRLGSIGWLILNILFCLPFLGAITSPWVWVVEGVLASLLLLQLVLAGRYGCRCYIQTAVSREELPSLIRTWTADKAFRRLREKIAEAQGTLPEELDPLYATAVPSTGNSAFPESGAHRGVDNRKQAVRSVNFALVAFPLFLLDALGTYPALGGPKASFSGTLWTTLSTILELGIGGALVGSLLAGIRVRSLKSLRITLIIALVTQGLDLYMSTVMATLYQVQRGVVSMDMQNFNLWRWGIGVDLALCILIGIGGLVLVLLNWDRFRRGDL
jgi:hypothetical protein